MGGEGVISCRQTVSEVWERSVGEECASYHQCGQAAGGTPPPAGLGREVKLQQTQDLAKRIKRFCERCRRHMEQEIQEQETEVQETK